MKKIFAKTTAKILPAIRCYSIANLKQRLFRATALTTAIFTALLFPVTPGTLTRQAHADNHLAEIEVVDIVNRGSRLNSAWVRVGLPLPEGALAEDEQIQVGNNLSNQLDIKSFWPGTNFVKFAVLNFRVNQPGIYAVTKGGRMSGSGKKIETPREISGVLSGGGEGPGTTDERQLSVKIEDWRPGQDPEVFEARVPTELPEFPGPDWWLVPSEHSQNGAYVFEWRHKLVPENAEGIPHPVLEVIVDLTLYMHRGRAEVAKLRVTIENTKDNPPPHNNSMRWYIAWLENGSGERLFETPGLAQGYLTRAVILNETFDITRNQDEPILANEPIVKWDPTPAYQAGALPEYDERVADLVNEITGSDFGILGKGALDPWMPNHGGREEIAPYPGWAARYLVHQNPLQGKFVLIHGDLSGSWPIHVREADGRLVSIDERPNYWLDARAPVGEKPTGRLDQTGPLTPDVAHQPSLALIPYLMTGERYYAEEMAFWANYVLLFQFQDAMYNGRGGSLGYLRGEQVRGMGWGLRNMADAASLLPDTDWVKAHLADKIANNLAWFDEAARNQQSPIGAVWFDIGKRPENWPGSGLEDRAWIALWELNYLNWGIHWANKQGFTGGLELLRKITEYQVRKFGGGREDCAAPYIEPVGNQVPPGSGNIDWYTEVPYPGPCNPAELFPGYYGVDTRFSLMIAIEWDIHRAEAEAAYEYLFYFIGIMPYFGDLSDLAQRAGWYLKRLV